MAAAARRLAGLHGHLAPRRLGSGPAADGAQCVALTPTAAATEELDGPSLPQGRKLDWRTRGLIAAGLDLEEMRRKFWEDGFYIVKNVVGEDERLNVQYELAELVDDTARAAGKAGQWEEEPWETRLLRLFEDDLDAAPEIYRPECHKAGLFCLFFHPAILDIASYIIGTQELRIYPNYGTRPKLPGKHRDEVLWHTDAGYTYFGPAADADKPDVRDDGMTPELVESEMAQSMVNVSCHDIAAIWVAFFSRSQRYRC